MAFTSSKAIRTKAEAVILTLDCGSTFPGFGESTPRSYVTGETLGTVVSVIRDILADFLLEQSFSSLADIEKILANLSSTCKNTYGHPFNSAWCH